MVSMCYLFILFSLFRGLNCDNTFFLVQSIDDGNFYCITNSSYALTWIGDDHTKTVNSNSIFVSESNLDITNSEWSFQNNQLKPYHSKYPVNAMILDRRWEELELFVSGDPNRNDDLNFTKPLVPLPYTSFRFSFSLRIEKGAHIFLCDGERLVKSNCYWLLLEAFNGTKTTVTKCKKEEIQFSDQIPVTSSCQQSLNEYSSENYLSNNTWIHIDLLKLDNIITMLQTNGKRGKVIVDYQDTDINPINATHLFIYSKDEKGFWKPHFSKPSIYINAEIKMAQLGPVVDVVEESICVSFYLLMCSKCQLEVTLSNASNSSDIIKKQKYSSKTHLYNRDTDSLAILTEWSHIKFVEKNIKHDKVILSISNSVKNMSDMFWAMDKVRLCQKNELRMITSKENLQCQLMSHYATETVLITADIELNHTKTEKYCPENTVGKLCIPCLWTTSRKCGKLKICEKYRNNLQCFCSAGYYGDNCDTPCRQGFYGHFCEQKCETCSENSCNNVNGTCGTCLDNYTGPKCEIPPATTFAEAPIVDNIKYRSIVVQVNNFKIVNETTHDPPRYFVIQYKEKENEWTDCSKKYEFGQKTILKIENLELDTTYYVRSVIVTQGGLKYADQRIPQREVTTKTCNATNILDIDITPSNTSANMYMYMTELGTFCNFEAFKILINNSNINIPKEITPNEVYFEKLAPFSHYEIILKNKFALIRKYFRTNIGVPEKILNLNVDKILPGSIILKWETPTHIYGPFQHYVVEYQHKSFLKCVEDTKIKPEGPSILNVTTNYVTLKSLEPYSKYSISVSCKNTQFTGDSTNLTHITPGASDAVREDEIPEIIKVIPKNVSVSIQFSEINCIKIRGVILMNITATCLSKWCYKNRTSQKSIYSSTDTLKLLHDLLPFSNYSLEVHFCRNDTFCSETVKTKRFRTESTSSPKVEDLLVYTKNESSVSLRWKLPDLVGLSKIEYKVCGDNFQKTENVTRSPCKLWPTYHCTTLGSLEENSIYCIKISAITEFSESFSQGEEIEAVTTQEKSKAPYDLRIHWSLDNDLELKWKHPNETNGDIRHFNIFLEPSDCNSNYSSILLVEPGEYKLVYHFKIRAKEILPSTKYKITIAANNGHLGQKLIGEDVSPPRIPVFATEPKFSTSQTTIAIEIPQNIINKKKVNNCKIFLLVSDNDSDLPTPPELQTFENQFNMSLYKFRVVCEHDCSSDLFDFTIGDPTKKCGNKLNPPLSPQTIYNVTILLINTFNNVSRWKIYSFEVTTSGEDPLSSGFKSYALIFVTIIAILGIVATVWLIHNFIKEQKLENDLTVENLDQELPLNSYIKHYGMGYSKESYYFNKITDVSKFQDYVKISLENGKLYEEHKILATNATKSVYDTINNNLFLDYIDVHFVSDNDDVSKAYVVTKMPSLNKVEQFWKLVWNDNVQHIILLSSTCTNNEQEFPVYWPTDNEELSFDNISIKLISCEIFTDYEQRQFILNYQEEIRNVHQLCFSSWLQNDIPSSAFLFVPFFQRISKIPLDSNSPILFHSSSGIEGTRFVLLCDICLRTAAKDGLVDVFRISKILANRPIGMFDNPKHYLLAHLVILENLIALDKFTDLLEAASDENQKIGEFLNYMSQTDWIDQSVKKLKREVYQEEDKIQLSLYLPVEDEEHEYTYIDTINTTTVKVFRNQKLIVVQQPTRFSVAYFWKFVEENDVDVIVSLNKTSGSSKNYQWWPNKHLKQIDISKITIKHKETVKFDNYFCTSLDLESKMTTRTVKMFSMKNWPKAKANCPENVSAFVDFCIESNRILKNSKSVMVTCNDGVTASGLYVAMLYNIGKMEVDKVCDVFAAARITRNGRHGFLKENEQLIFLWRATENYLSKETSST